MTMDEMILGIEAHELEADYDEMAHEIGVWDEETSTLLYVELIRYEDEWASEYAYTPSEVDGARINGEEYHLIGADDVPSIVAEYFKRMKSE